MSSWAVDAIPPCYPKGAAADPSASRTLRNGAMIHARPPTATERSEREHAFLEGRRWQAQLPNKPLSVTDTGAIIYRADTEGPRGPRRRERRSQREQATRRGSLRAQTRADTLPIPKIDPSRRYSAPAPFRLDAAHASPLLSRAALMVNGKFPLSRRVKNRCSLEAAARKKRLLLI